VTTMRHDQIALQLYTLRRLAAKDLAATLRSVAGAGYTAVEIAGLPDTEPAELRRMLDGNGLRAIASHVGIDRLREDAGAAAARLGELGCARAIVPWMPEEDRRTTDDVRRFAAELGEHGRRLAEDGIGIGYHNHSFEFETLGGTTIWDALLEALPPAVDLELDVFWASVGGRDPVTEIATIRDRVRLLHMKDRTADPTPRDAPAGDGILPFAGIVDAGRAAGVEWYIVEQDEPLDPLQDVATSFRFLGSLAV
jgi:sugar phosphate isomerase/epimerase